MRLIFLGTAAALVTDPENYQSNMLLRSPSGESLLIDCGADVRRSLHTQGFDHQDIGSVYLSHLHADHAGGLEWLAFARKFAPNPLSKPHFYLTERLVKPLWEHTLSGGLTSLTDEPASLSAYFQMHPVVDGGGFDWEGIHFYIIENPHIESEFAHMPSYGLLFEVNGQTIFLTTDMQFQPDHAMPYYHAAQLIFQDCETSVHPSGVHAHYQELKTLDPAIKAKMWLYHYNDAPSQTQARADGFCGFVRPGQHFNL
jgi:ribonuclease BN (tRNA processing enzyme)